MESPQGTPSHGFGESPSGSLRKSMAEAMRFWEPRRILYTLTLGAVFAAWVVATWPHFRPAMTPFSLFRFAVLGLLANVCYSAAYLVELPLQLSGGGAAWRNWRWGLWTLGMLLAVLFENYWIADEIYPFV